MSVKGAADLHEGRAVRARAPMAATLQVTDRCNYECVHCYQEHDKKHDELSLDEIRRILGQLADAGTLYLILVGGEFFMRRDADEILTIAHELGFAIRLKTTGHHVTDARADFLMSVRPLEVDLSVYAAGKHEHEAVTRMPGSWQRTLDAARRLIARGIPVVLRTPVMQSNAGEIEALRALAEEMGAQVSFDPKIVAREDASLEPIALRMDAPTLRTFYGDTMGEHIVEKYSTFDPMHSNTDDGTPCGAGWRGVAIDPLGKVWPCSVLPIPAGDLRADSFHDIWFGSETLKDLRNLTWAKLSECNRCEVRPYCQRCHAMALIEHGNMNGPSLEACRHAVATRDALRERGAIPATETAMPPTWDRVDLDGQHERLAPGRRPSALRVLP
jgi:radical SAM protein with 4Fe4S-binding SPASM domain